MANLCYWYETQLPVDVVEIIERDLQNYDDKVENSRVISGEDKVIRNSKHAWVPTSSWIGGFIWHYIERANRENFLYDLTCIDGENMQYTQYGPGEFYNWHIDAGLSTCLKPNLIAASGENMGNQVVGLQGEQIRKLSFALQLSDYSDYTGGDVQFLDNGNTFFAPKSRGTLMIFDSRVPHRVRKVKSGLRKSLVGWVVGPRWK